MRFGLLAVVGLAGVSLTSQAFAITFPAPSFFGEANTTFQQWEGFSSVTAPNAPTSFTNTAGAPSYRDATGATDGAFIIGPPVGRIYSFSGVVHPEITVPNTLIADGTTDIVLQTQTLGSPLDQTTFYALANGSSTPILASSVVLTQSGEGTGASNNYVVTWDDLPSATGYTITYTPNTSSSSQVGARVDTITSVSVPEPTAVAGLALLGAGLLRRRSR